MNTNNCGEDAELKVAMREAMMSETFQKVTDVCGRIPVDVTNTDELKTALSTTMREVISGIDNGDIIFKTVNAERFTLAFLSIALRQVVGNENITEVKIQ